MATCCAGATDTPASMAMLNNSGTARLEPTCNTILRVNGLLEQHFRDRLQLHILVPS